MSERSRRFNRAVFVKTAIALLCVTVFAIFYGCDYDLLDKIDDYQSFLHGYTKYGRALWEEDYPMTAPDQIAGFVPLCAEKFTFGKTMNGGATFVQKEDENFMLYHSGVLRKIAIDLRSVALTGEWYICEEQGNKGVSDVYGNTVVPMQYERVEIVDTTVLAFSRGKAYSYQNGNFCGAAEVAEDCRLADANHIYSNAHFYSLDFSLLSVDDCPYIDLPSNGMVSVSKGDGTVTYANVSEHKLWDASYKTARRFCENRAVVTLMDDSVAVLDKSGNTLYVTHNKEICDKSGEYHCYWKNGMYGVLNADFADITGAIFAFVRYEKAVENYLIVRRETQETLFDLNTLQYGDIAYDTIEYNDGLFFGYHDGAVSVFDADLQVLTTCDSVAWNEGVLTVQKNGYYAYYVREK